MRPAPDGHFTNPEEPSGGGVTAKHHLEQKIVPAAGNPAFEGR